MDERSGPFRAVPASPEVYTLAEGPVWDTARERILWVDINAGHVHTGGLIGDRIEPRERFSFPGTVGAVACSEAGELLVAGRRHLYTATPDGTTTSTLQLIPDDTASRLNDGGCDPAGRFLIGSMALDDRRNQESLYRIEDSGHVTVIDDDLSLSNGLAWAPDGTSLYSIDTTPAVVWIRSYDTDSGSCGERREFLRIRDGHPDGLCIDVDGNLWIAIWGAGQVRCYSPSGEQLTTVEVPAPHTSSVAFVGAQLDVLLITTALNDLTDEQLTRYPDSGRLFTCRVSTTGAPVPSWSGVHPCT